MKTPTNIPQSNNIVIILSLCFIILCLVLFIVLKPDKNVYIRPDTLDEIRIITNKIGDVEVKIDSLNKQVKEQKKQDSLYKTLYNNTKNYYENSKIYIPSYDALQLDSVIRANSGLPPR